MTNLTLDIVERNLFNNKTNKYSVYYKGPDYTLYPFSTCNEQVEFNTHLEHTHIFILFSQKVTLFNFEAYGTNRNEKSTSKSIVQFKHIFLFMIHKVKIF